MSERLDFEAGLEPERYELQAAPAYRFHLGRRNVFKFLAGGIVVLILPERVFAQESGGEHRRGRRPGVSQEIGAWLHIGEDGQVTAYTGKVEVGQNIRTSLTQVVAEELHAPLGSIRLVMGDTQLTPFDAGTFGSRTTPDMARQLRRVAAAARELLVDLAAQAWKTDRALLTADNGRITYSQTQQEIDFGKLTKGQRLTIAIPDNPSTTPADQWKITGHSAAKINGQAFVTGQHKYVSDIKLPGMLHGKVLRPPSIGATLVSMDAKEAEAIPNVRFVRDGDFVGVVAPNEFLASRALKTIKAEWKLSPQISGRELVRLLEETKRRRTSRP